MSTETTVDGFCHDCGEYAALTRTEREQNRVAYKWGQEFQEDVPVEAWVCGPCREETER